MLKFTCNYQKIYQEYNLLPKKMVMIKMITP